jgi:hypothetical protein
MTYAAHLGPDTSVQLDGLRSQRLLTGVSRLRSDPTLEIRCIELPLVAAALRRLTRCRTTAFLPGLCVRAHFELSATHPNLA